MVVELGAELFGLLATQGIDDPTIALVVLQKIHKLIEAATFGLHVVLNIGPVEARHKNLGPLQFKLVVNVVHGINWSAVAVRAIIGTSGKEVRSLANCRYSGRKS